MSFTFWLAIYGITFVVCDAGIFQHPRTWVVSRSDFLSRMLECYFCTGFWVSMILHAVELRSQLHDPIAYLWGVALGGFAGASFAFITNNLSLHLEHTHARNHPPN